MTTPHFADRVAYRPAEFPRTPKAVESFGAWLLAQVDRGDWVDDLAKAARADADFPRTGSVEDVRARLVKRGADGDAHAQLDDAELDWLSL